MAEDAAKLVSLRNEFYRDNYRRVTAALLLTILINLVLIGVIYYQLTHRPSAQYFATSNDGKIVKLYPLNEPVVAPSVLLQWANNAAVAVYTYNFKDYRHALQRAQNKFTAAGWSNFEAALKGARTLETVLTKKLVVTAVATAAPIILDRGVINGRYVWKVNIPLLVSYESASELTQQPIVVTMIVSRVPTVNNPDGIAIVSFVAAEGQISGGGG